jgi:hypothetical protein
MYTFRAGTDGSIDVVVNPTNTTATPGTTRSFALVNQALG